MGDGLFVSRTELLDDGLSESLELDFGVEVKPFESSKDCFRDSRVVLEFLGGDELFKFCFKSFCGSVVDSLNWFKLLSKSLLGSFFALEF